MSNLNRYNLDYDGMVKFAQKLIRTPSLSGEEKNVADLVAAEMEKLGYDRFFVDARHNAIGVIEGKNEGPTLMLNGHLDHADVGEMIEPYSGKIIDGAAFGTSGPVLYGRGACDMKGALASMIYAVGTVKRENLNLKGKVIVTANSLEEVSLGHGINYIFEEDGISADMVVNGEATNLNICIGHRGMMEVKVTVKGKTAHASNPGNGINAIYQASEFIRFIKHNYRLPDDQFLGRCTFTAIDITAKPGRLTPIVPDCCEIFFDRRTLPGDTPAKIVDEFLQLIEKARENIENFDAQAEVTRDFPSLLCSENEPVLEALKSARKKVLGDEGRITSWTFGTDGAFIAQKNIPCIGFGPGNELYAHTGSDHVSLHDLKIAAAVYYEMIKEVCT